MWEIERELRMESHIRWKETNDRNIKKYQTYGPRGHDMNIFIYILTSLGAPILGLLKQGYSSWLLLPVPIIILTVTMIIRNEKRIKKLLAKFEQCHNK